MMNPERRKIWAPPSTTTRILIYLTFFSLFSFLLFVRGYRVTISGKQWDVMIFTQSWPNTVCMTWEEKNPTNNTCRLPQEKDIWSIHGIWPTKLGTVGPSFCNTSSHFNATALAPIINNLTEYWIDVEVPHPANSFWKHEWLKHGTCAASLPSMSTELKYFEQGLKWSQQYNMRDVLKKGGVHPDSNSGLDITDIWLAVKTTLGINPYMHCELDKKTGQYYLQELRICFDKSLKLMDCDGISTRLQFRWQPLGNCPEDKPIFYPSSIPSPSRKPRPPPPDATIFSLFKVVRLLMWFTS